MLALPATTPIPPLCHRADPRDPLARDRSWWLCHAHTRQEKALAADLAGADVPHLLPLRREEKRRPAGKQQRYAIDLALFPGYLFISGDDLDYLNARASRRVIHLWPVFDVAGLVRDLSQLLDAIEAGGPIGKARPAPKAGGRFRVTSGPFEGKEGTLERVEGHGGVLLLHVHCLGQVVPLSVEEWRCEPVED